MFLGWPHRLISPFVKWAGGKGQLVDRLTALMPDRYNRYYEPFVGGGAMLLAVQPKDACINDINASLINTYRVIRDSPEEFIATIDALSQTPCTKLIYAVYRDAYNQMMLEGKAGARMAALFVYLNKHCFNGLYRVNSKGPSMFPGTTRPPVIPSPRRISGHCPSICRAWKSSAATSRTRSRRQGRGTSCSWTAPTRL